MKRFSKSFHTTLSEINITPLLDLAFVLLVIFVITTTPLVQDKDLALPQAASRPKDPPQKPNYISVDKSGKIFLNMVPMDLAQLQTKLIEMRKVEAEKKSGELSVIMRGDANILYAHVVNVIEVLQNANVVKVSLATDALPLGKPDR